MKRIVKVLGVILVAIFSMNVFAANYELRELIPKQKETTIVTNHFSYRSFSYNGEGYITFKSIKNITNDPLPISISIGLFDKEKKNIGTINYCSEEDKLNGKEERTFSIPVTKKYLGDDFSITDIAYISVLEDNITCKQEGKDYYIGQTVEKIGQPKNTTLDSDARLFLIVISVVGGFIVLILISKLFSGSYENMDGDDVRIGFKKYNRKLRDDRARELRLHPPKPPEKIKTKTDQVLAQEEAAKTEDKAGTDLHNFYK